MPPGDPSTTARFQTAPFAIITERDKELLADLRRALAMAISRCILSPCATAWPESLEGATSGHQTLAVLYRCRCRLLLAEVPNGSDRNADLNLRLGRWATLVSLSEEYWGSNIRDRSAEENE